MGSMLTNIWSKLFNTNKLYNILIVGLANAGKTTLLYRMSLGKTIETTPTIGSNLQQIKHKNVSFSAWDLGGQQRIRVTWQAYYARADAIIFVIDSTDTKNEVIAKTELFKIVINENLKGVPVLILANKQDLKGALNEQQLAIKYSFHQIKDHSWRLQLCSALQGNGVNEAMDWLTDQLIKKK